MSPTAREGDGGDRGPTFPPEVFDAAVLRGLDARARRDVEAAGRVRTIPQGGTCYRAGDPGESFFVVIDGAIALEAVRRGDAAASELRVAEAGASFGEECTVGLARRANAVARTRARVAEIPVHVFRRAAGRAGAGDVAGRLERALRRAATRDLFATLAFTRALPERDLDVLLDAATHVSTARGEHVYREGEAARELFFLVDGLVQLQVEDGERLHVRGYVGRGDFFGDAEILEGGARTHAAVSSGASQLVAVPADVVRRLAREHPELMPAMRRVASEHRAAIESVVACAAANATQHVFRDLYRMQVARSLLVIDLETCVRCGHCAWSCAAAHDDGEARLVRRGDKMIARVDGRGAGAPSSLLLPNSCQHCENPACMVDCPTGAIGKEAGEVFIRPELCTGCGACAKACPWENIHMAERPDGVPRPATTGLRDGPVADFGSVAVKCDLCRDGDGPACVQHCPTGSIFRMNPAEDIADVRQLLGRAPAKRDAATARNGAALAERSAAAGGARDGAGAQLLGGASIAAFALAIVGGVMRARGAWGPGAGVALAAGALAGAGMLALLAYAIPKRLVRRGSQRSAGRRVDGAVTSKVAPQLDVHLALGVLTIGLAYAHAPWPLRGGNPSGAALAWLLAATSVAGAVTAIAYRLVPRRLARIERRAALPEDYAAARRALIDRLYRAASGKSDLVKKLLETTLLPYARSLFGPAALVAAGRTLREEEAHVRARIDEKLDGRGKERLAGLDELVKLVVELRALPAQRLLTRTLRAGLPLHVVTFAAAVAALLIHVAVALLRGRT